MHIRYVPPTIVCSLDMLSVNLIHITNLDLGFYITTDFPFYCTDCIGWLALLSLMFYCD